mmetsp:Transcript_19862/g.59982  ORF Transcript_19862/g.59982 Transcript_19862/m.59982 type:complete len:202 (+) Transcript_19862:73-678(+)
MMGERERVSFLCPSARAPITLRTSHHLQNIHKSFHAQFFAVIAPLQEAWKGEAEGCLRGSHGHPGDAELRWLRSLILPHVSLRTAAARRQMHAILSHRPAPTTTGNLSGWVLRVAKVVLMWQKQQRQRQWQWQHHSQGTGDRTAKRQNGPARGIQAALCAVLKWTNTISSIWTTQRIYSFTHGVPHMRKHLNRWPSPCSTT